VIKIRKINQILAIIGVLLVVLFVVSGCKTVGEAFRFGKRAAPTRAAEPVRVAEPTPYDKISENLDYYYGLMGKDVDIDTVLKGSNVVLTMFSIYASNNEEQYDLYQNMHGGDVSVKEAINMVAAGESEESLDKISGLIANEMAVLKTQYYGMTFEGVHYAGLPFLASSFVTSSVANLKAIVEANEQRQKLAAEKGAAGMSPPGSEELIPGVGASQSALQSVIDCVEALHEAINAQTPGGVAGPSPTGRAVENGTAPVMPSESEGAVGPSSSSVTGHGISPILPAGPGGAGAAGTGLADCMALQAGPGYAGATGDAPTPAEEEYGPGDGTPAADNLNNQGEKNIKEINEKLGENNDAAAEKLEDAGLELSASQKAHVKKLLAAGKVVAVASYNTGGAPAATTVTPNKITIKFHPNFLNDKELTDVGAMDFASQHELAHANLGGTDEEAEHQAMIAANLYYDISTGFSMEGSGSVAGACGDLNAALDVCLGSDENGRPNICDMPALAPGMPASPDCGPPGGAPQFWPGMFGEYYTDPMQYAQIAMTNLATTTLIAQAGIFMGSKETMQDIAQGKGMN